MSEKIWYKSELALQSFAPFNAAAYEGCCVLEFITCLVLSAPFPMCVANGTSTDIEKCSLEQLNQKMKEEPKNPALWERKGRVLAGGFEDEAAVQAFSRAISLKPDFARAYFDRRLCYKHQLKCDLAKADFLKATLLLKASPANARLLTDTKGQLAGVYDLEKNYAAELPLLKQNAEAIKHGVDYARVAGCEIKPGLFADAEIDYKRALKLSPNDSEIMASLAALFVQKKIYAEAIEQYTMAIETTKKSGRSFLIRKHHLYYEKRGMCYKELGEKELSARDMRTYKGWADGLYDASPFRLK